METHGCASDVTALTGSRWLGDATLQRTVSIQLLLGNQAHNTQRVQAR